ncbi:MAG TPA: hypothetical protein VHU19_14185 [Pyrinomonadaceae bacterium]|jgi:hypothetical protein|nr:hypothetical protein [Pyrinomonadaceae bacterium]
MNRRLLFPLLLIALLLCACTTKWETVSETGFTAQMPGTPQKQTQSVDTAVGSVAFNTYSVQNGSEAFIVGYNDFPDNAATQNADPQELLNKARDGAVQNVNGKVTNEKPITMDGHPGKEFSGESSTPQEATFTARVYWVAPRLYQVLYIRPKTTSAPSENGQKFLDSFQLTGSK